MKPARPVKICLLPPLDVKEDRGFWMTPLEPLIKIEPFRVVAIFGCGRPVEEAFLLIRSMDKKQDIAALSIAENPRQIWGEGFSTEEQVKLFIRDFKGVQ